MRRRMIIAPYYRDGWLFASEMLRKGEFQPDDKIYHAQRPEHLRGFRLGEGCDEVQTWFLQGHWPCRWREEIERMIEMEALALIYSGGDIRRWFI
jgi:hypothetical protein